MSQELLKSLSMYFVLALIFESGFNLIFSWRLFIKYLGNKGWKTPIMILAAWIIFETYDLDIISNVIREFGAGNIDQVTTGGKFLTALFIAGGSGAVNNVLNVLKVRDDGSRKEHVQKEIKLKELLHQLKTLTQKRDKLKNEVTSFEQLCVDAKDALEALEKNYIEKEETIEILKTEIQSIRGHMTALLKGRDIETLVDLEKSQMDDLNTSFEEKQSLLKEQENQMNELKDQVDAIKIQGDDLNEKYYLSKKQYSEVEFKIKQLELDKRSLEIEIGD